MRKIKKDDSKFSRSSVYKSYHERVKTSVKLGPEFKHVKNLKPLIKNQTTGNGKYNDRRLQTWKL